MTRDLGEAAVSDPTRQEATALERAAIAYGKAKAALVAYRGDRRSPAFAEVLAAWRSAMLELDTAATRRAEETEAA